MHWVMLYHTMLLLLWSSLAVLPKILDKDHMPSGCKSFFLDWQEIVVIPLSMFQSWSHPTSLQQFSEVTVLSPSSPPPGYSTTKWLMSIGTKKTGPFFRSIHSAVWLIPILDSSSWEWGQVPPGPRHTELTPLPCGLPWFSPLLVSLRSAPSAKTQHKLCLFQNAIFPIHLGVVAQSPPFWTGDTGIDLGLREPLVFDKKKLVVSVKEMIRS